MTRKLPQSTETAAKRMAYGLSAGWIVLVLAGIFDHSFALFAAAAGFPAGLWMGRLTEARENVKGNGLILSE